MYLICIDHAQALEDCFIRHLFRSWILRKSVELYAEHCFGEWDHAVIDGVVVADWSHGRDVLNVSAVMQSDLRRYHHPVAATGEGDIGHWGDDDEAGVGWRWWIA